MSFDPHSNEWLLNRFEIYKDLRTRDTAYWSDKFQAYVITRYDDVYFALTNPKIFSSARGNLLIETAVRYQKTLGASDNPYHTEFKNIVLNAYTKDNVDRIASIFREKMIGHFDNKTEINISEITDDLSAWMVTELLNFPVDKDMMHNTILNIHQNEPNIHVFGPDDHPKDLKDEYTLIYETFRLRPPSLGPGVYHECMNNNPKNLDSIFLVIANILSGTGSLVGALQYLTLDMYEQNQLDVLLNDRSLIPDAVNESLRFHTSTGRFGRSVTEEITMHGINLKPDDRVVLCLESANHDPTKFTNPEEFILSRNDNVKHLGWGYGIHACIALAISKEILAVYLETLLDKAGKYDIMTKHSDLKYTYVKGGNIDIMSNIMLRTANA